MYDRVYRVNLKAIKHSVKNLNYFFCSLACLMGDVLFVWTAVCQTCLMRACVPRLLSGLYQLFDLCLSLNSQKRLDQTCFNRLATHFNISMFGHQTMFDGVWSPNISRLSRRKHLVYLHLVYLRIRRKEIKSRSNVVRLPLTSSLTSRKITSAVEFFFPNP